MYFRIVLILYLKLNNRVTYKIVNNGRNVGMSQYNLSNVLFKANVLQHIGLLRACRKSQRVAEDLHF